MAKKTDIKKCRYPYCKHENKEIDISVEEYKVSGKMYYHTDCYKAKIEGEWKDKQTKADLQLIKNLWIENISNTVVFSQLYHSLNDLLQRGIESGYLVFVIQYCIKHQMNLRYPQGLKYYVDNKEIKDAYNKKTRPVIKVSDFTAEENVVNDEVPKFSVNKKPTGFKSILGGR